MQLIILNCVLASILLLSHLFNNVSFQKYIHTSILIIFQSNMSESLKLIMYMYKRYKHLYRLLFIHYHYQISY